MNRTQTATSGLVRPPTPARDGAGPDSITTQLAQQVRLEPGLSDTLEVDKVSDKVSDKGHRLLGRKRILLSATGLALLGLVTAGGYHWWQYARHWTKTDNAYVSAHIHLVSSRVAGTVGAVLVDENQDVAAGQLLVQLDPGDFNVRREQALAQVAQARAQIQQAVAQIEQARAQVGREEARSTKAKQDLLRAESLSQGSNGAISRQEFDQAKAEADAAGAGLLGAHSGLAAAEGAAAAARGREQVAQANLQEAELQLSYTELRAPAAGRIGKRNLETGNRIAPGQALLALVEPEIWVTANFK